MATKEQLRVIHKNMILNENSKKQEKDFDIAVKCVIELVNEKFPKIKLRHDKLIKLNSVIENIKNEFPDVDFSKVGESSFMKPDGGLLYAITKNNKMYPILIAEVKRQGTNDTRASEGLEKQANGNAIERLGKNVIGLRTYMMTENIFPFVCFGHGCDFGDTSIPDRVRTIAMFGELNKQYLHNQGQFNRGSFYFRESKWSTEEMVERMYDIAEKSLFYYFSKYGEDALIKKQ
jgi:type II restriction enzyme